MSVQDETQARRILGLWRGASEAHTLSGLERASNEARGPKDQRISLILNANWNKIGLILLAAGKARRMGSPKQLLDFGGKPLIRHSTEAVLASVCRPVVVVLGSSADQVQMALDGLAVEIVHNQQWEQGVGTSIRAGIEAISRHDVDGTILTLADQPLIHADIFNRLVENFRRSEQPIVASEYSGTVGVPVLFSREFFGELCALAADKGCKGVILDHLDCATRLPCPEAESDIDTPTDYARLCPNKGRKLTELTEERTE